MSKRASTQVMAKAFEHFSRRRLGFLPFLLIVKVLNLSSSYLRKTRHTCSSTCQPAAKYVRVKSFCMVTATDIGVFSYTRFMWAPYLFTTQKFRKKINRGRASVLAE